MIKNFLKDEEGMGTVELVLIIAALVTVAVIFRKYVINFVKNQMQGIFDNDELTQPGDTKITGIETIGQIQKN